jgi:hypothetical protein
MQSCSGADSVSLEVWLPGSSVVHSRTEDQSQLCEEALSFAGAARARRATDVLEI